VLDISWLWFIITMNEGLFSFLRLIERVAKSADEEIKIIEKQKKVACQNQLFLCASFIDLFSSSVT
jgi:hypothetical protein